jgi:hypothetical protein
MNDLATYQSSDEELEQNTRKERNCPLPLQSDGFSERKVMEY